MKIQLLLATAATLAANDAARAVLSKHCLACHGEAKMGGLDLRDRASLLKGGTRGPAIVTGKSSESLLMKAVRREGALAMPPGKATLTAPEIEALRSWIDTGATYDGAVAATSSWWSFQKVKRPGGNWTVDKFIDAKLAEKGLARSPRASKRTLIRRATFDLHGLPPTPEEIANFEADTAPNAFAKVVDRLLASPRYGERWGRHWLDVARYADTTGDRHNNPNNPATFAYAWTYRDYVIRAFNQDKPFDQFIVEQIAADRLPLGEDRGALAALGFETKRGIASAEEIRIKQSDGPAPSAPQAAPVKRRTAKADPEPVAAGGALEDHVPRPGTAVVVEQVFTLPGLGGVLF